MLRLKCFCVNDKICINCYSPLQPPFQNDLMESCVIVMKNFINLSEHKCIFCVTCTNFYK